MSGHFVWHDLATTDPEAAKAFYPGLLGWTAQTSEGEYGTYTMWHNDGVGLGGIMPIGPEQQGAPPHWLSYLHAPGTIEVVVANVSARGGTVMQPPFEIPTIGKMAVIADPQGAVIAPFEAAPMDGEPPAPPAPGTKGGVAWHELLTTDVAAAADFYAQIGGFTTTTMDVGTGPYTMLVGDKGPTAGIMSMPDGVTHPAWMVYFEIAQDSMEEALAAVTRLGGQVGMGPMEVPTVGTIAAVADPTGAWFCLLKSAQP